MDFVLSEQQSMFRDSVAAFARNRLADGALARAHAAEFPREVAQKMARAGLLGITLPEADGGASGALMDAVLAIERVASFCRTAFDVIQEGNFGAIRVLGKFANADPEKAIPQPVAAWRGGHRRGYDRARCRLGDDRPRDDGGARRQGVPLFRAPGVSKPRRPVSCPCATARGVRGIAGDDTARRPGYGGQRREFMSDASGRRSISITFMFRRKTCCCRPAGSSGRSAVSMPSASAMQPARLHTALLL
jgi:hypothetical protein